MNELREQISMALGDAWSMDEDKQAAVDAVMTVLKAAAVVQAERDKARQQLATRTDLAKMLEEQRDTAYTDRDELQRQLTEAQTERDQLRTWNASLKKELVTVQGIEWKLRSRVDTLEAAQARYLMWYEAEKEKVASLQARVKAYRRVWFDRRNWLGLTQIKLLMTEARVADLDALIANLDINDFCELCEAHRSLCLCYQSFAPEATQQPTADQPAVDRCWSPADDYCPNCCAYTCQCDLHPEDQRPPRITCEVCDGCGYRIANNDTGPPTLIDCPQCGGSGYEAADQPAACPTCNDTGYRRERHAIRLQPCPHCDSANDKPEPPVDGGEGA